MPCHEIEYLIRWTCYRAGMALAGLLVDYSTSIQHASSFGGFTSALETYVARQDGGTHGRYQLYRNKPGTRADLRRIQQMGVMGRESRKG